MFVVFYLILVNYNYEVYLFVNHIFICIFIKNSFHLMIGRFDKI